MLDFQLTRHSQSRRDTHSVGDAYGDCKQPGSTAFGGLWMSGLPANCAKPKPFGRRVTGMKLTWIPTAAGMVTVRTCVFWKHEFDCSGDAGCTANPRTSHYSGVSPMNGVHFRTLELLLRLGVLVGHIVSRVILQSSIRSCVSH